MYIGRIASGMVQDCFMGYEKEMSNTSSILRFILNEMP